MQKKVMVAMSGGVDSSVAAALLLDEGYTLCGATLKLFSNEQAGICDKERTCCSLDDVEDARSVAAKLGFTHYVFNFGSEFQKKVVSRFAGEYAAGRTPNPCIDCNRFIKFGKLLERAELLDFDHIATGHYAKTEFDEKSGRWLLKKAADLTKDQSYVLYAMTQKELSHTLFPLGGLTKSTVREVAEQRGLVNARKPDSQDICFVKDGDYAKFLKDVFGLRPEPGNFVDKDGNVLGRHKGIIHYTVGQRKGLGLVFETPKYVISKDLASNTVTLGDESELFSDHLIAEDVNLISISALTAPMQVTAKTRYRGAESQAVISPREDGRVDVVFQTPQRAITPGQAVVFYQGDIVVGGGTISAEA